MTDRKRKTNLFLQWHLPEPVDLLPEIFSDCSCSRHRFPVIGSFPACAGSNNIEEEPCLPFDTLPSPVIDEINDDEFVGVGVFISFDKLKTSLDFTAVTALEFPIGVSTFGFVKSSVNAVCGGAGDDVSVSFAGAKFNEGARDNEVNESGWTGTWTGPRRNRAWPVRSIIDITFLNFETVKSAISRQSTWTGSWETNRIKCSMDFKPAEAASCRAKFSVIFETTAIFFLPHEEEAAESVIYKGKKWWPGDRVNR